MQNNPQTFTLNKLQTYDECPQKYKLCYIDKVHIVEPITQTRTGNNLHSVINQYLKGQDTTKLIEALPKQEKVLWHNFKNSPIQNYNIKASEYEFNLKIDEYWLTGRIDALFEHDNNYIILDWKTGSSFKPENVKFQTAFYLLCIYEILKQKKIIQEPEELSLHYMDLNSNSIIKIKFDIDLYTQYKKQILETIIKINENKNYFCNKTDKCRYCKYLRACPYY